MTTVITFRASRRLLVGILLAAAPLATGCQQNVTAPTVPPIFSPSPCPSGWQYGTNPSDPRDVSCQAIGILQPSATLRHPTVQVPS